LDGAWRQPTIHIVGKNAGTAVLRGLRGARHQNKSSEILAFVFSPAG
jgi:hypothetical protein